MNNSSRFDLSDYLIHFFRRVDLLSDLAPVLVPEVMGFSNLQEDTEWSAVFMLRCAIRHQRLWSTWSYRGGTRTIYGRAPAVCFTEMPLAAFLDAGQSRAERGEAMSPYALVFPKRALYSLGANPVIYGLDNRHASAVRHGEARIFAATVLPEDEQYRYVTYNPLRTRPIDWTHEREWRWPFRGDLAKFERELEEVGVISDPHDMPGLMLNTDALTGMGVVVRTRKEAEWVTSDILALVDRELVAPDHYQFILVSDELIPRSIQGPEELREALAAASIDLAPFFLLLKQQISTINLRFDQIIARINNKVGVAYGEKGGVWLWLTDSSHVLTRALLATGRVKVSKDGRYLAHLEEFSSRRGMSQREAMTKELAKHVFDEFGVEGDYFSVLNSWDYDEVPYYVGRDHIDNRHFYNVSW